MVTRITEIQVKTEVPEIYEEIKAYITQKGEDYENWFVGVTADVERSLFSEHRVYRYDDLWIFRKCLTNRAVENIKNSLLRLGCDGFLGGWVNSHNYVYAYRKTAHSKP